MQSKWGWLKAFFKIICVYVCVPLICMWTSYMQCQWRPKEGARSSRKVVPGGCGVLETKPGSARTAKCSYDPSCHPSSPWRLFLILMFSHWIKPLFLPNNFCFYPEHLYSTNILWWHMANNLSNDFHLWKFMFPWSPVSGYRPFQWHYLSAQNINQLN